jgi:predicted nucleotidyltransferase
VVVSGSYAYGEPTEDSDVDVLVIMPFNRKRGRKSL